MAAHKIADLETGRDLVRKLKSIARDREAIDIAQFQFVALDEIREAYGDRWRVERRRIQTVAGAFITKRLQPIDILIPCENGFLIVFNDSEQVDAGQMSEGIGRDLNA